MQVNPTKKQVINFLAKICKRSDRIAALLADVKDDLATLATFIDPSTMNNIIDSLDEQEVRILPKKAAKKSAKKGRA